MPATAELEEPEVLEVPTLDLAAPAGPDQHITITPGKMWENYAEKLNTGQVTEEHLARLNWLIALAKLEKLSMGGLSKLCGIDTGTLSKLFNANYGAKLDSICDRIDKFRQLHEARKSINKADFVQTSLVRSIWEVCETAFVYQTIYPIWGESQIGKTLALLEYQKAHNHGRTIYVRMPALGHKTEFLKALNRAIFENAETDSSTLMRVPMTRITPRNLLIVDELHQTVLGSRERKVREGTLEYLRELWDHTKCGMVICGTNVFTDTASKSRSVGVIKQLLRRGFPAMELPDLLPREDMDAIAAAYGLPPADDETHELRTDIIKTTGLRAYTNFLKAGTRFAEKKSAGFTWKHFTSAHDIMKKLSVRKEAK